MKMRSNRPYLLQAFYDWIVDNDCTPYVVVDAHYAGVEIPQDYVTDGQIVLNIAPRAVSGFVMDKQAVQFSTRFGGMPIDIFLPVGAIVGIYAQENGQGMVFEPEPEQPPPTKPDKPKPVKTSKRKPQISDESKGKPSLRVVK